MCHIVITTPIHSKTGITVTPCYNQKTLEHFHWPKTKNIRVEPKKTMFLFEKKIETSVQEHRKTLENKLIRFNWRIILVESPTTGSALITQTRDRDYQTRDNLEAASQESTKQLINSF